MFWSRRLVGGLQFSLGMPISPALQTAVYLFDRSLLLGREANYIWRYRLSIVPFLTILLHGATTLNFALLCYEQMVNLDCKVCSQRHCLS